MKSEGTRVSDFFYYESKSKLILYILGGGKGGMARENDFFWRGVGGWRRGLK